MIVQRHAQYEANSSQYSDASPNFSSPAVKRPVEVPDEHKDFIENVWWVRRLKSSVSSIQLDLSYPVTSYLGISIICSAANLGGMYTEDFGRSGQPLEICRSKRDRNDRDRECHLTYKHYTQRIISIARTTATVSNEYIAIGSQQCWFHV